jgi:hypothetical protein
MTAATAGPRPFSLFSGQGYGPHRLRRPAFLFSFVAQAVTVGLLVYFTCRIGNQPTTLPGLNRLGVCR